MADTGPVLRVSKVRDCKTEIALIEELTSSELMETMSIRYMTSQTLYLADQPPDRFATIFATRLVELLEDTNHVALHDITIFLHPIRRSSRIELEWDAQKHLVGPLGADFATRVHVKRGNSPKTGVRLQMVGILEYVVLPMIYL
jgi:hypothetical protein